MKEKPKVCVIGSINMDMVTSIDRIPDQGETVLGGSFRTNPGGKGANQAIAAARLGADVSFIGAVGDDVLGKELVENLKKEKINTTGIRIIPGESTGIATIIISDHDNRIIVASGANTQVTPELIAESKALITASDMVLLQFEIPMAAIVYAVNLAHEHNVPIIVNPAPYEEIPNVVLTKTTFFTPNEGEFAEMKALGLNEVIKGKLIITKSKHGAEYYTPGGKKHTVPAYQVPIKDTTGAGDTFNGALATELARKSGLKQAITIANAAAALSVQKFGAQAGMPSEQDVIDFLKQYK